MSEALNRVISRVEEKIAESKNDQLRIVAAAGLESWEDAAALTDEELLRYRDDAVYDEAWARATYEHHEAYDEESGRQGAFTHVLVLLQEERGHEG